MVRRAPPTPLHKPSLIFSEFIRPPPLRPSRAHADSTLRSSGRSRSPNTVLPRNILHKPDKGDGGSRRKGRSPSVPEPTYPLAVLLPPNSVRSEQNVCGPPVCIPVSSAGSCRRAHRQPQVQVAGRSCGHHGPIGVQYVSGLMHLTLNKY